MIKVKTLDVEMQIILAFKLFWWDNISSLARQLDWSELNDEILHIQLANLQ